MKGAERPGEPRATLRSRAALDAVNFFLAQPTGIGSPYLGALLRERGWRYEGIGVAASMPGLGVFLLQSIAGMVLDRWYHPRLALALSALTVGLGYAALPLLPPSPPATIYAILFVTGLAQSFFAPVLAGLALALSGHGGLSRTMGSNQAWNHIGSVAAAVIALLVVRGGLSFVFYTIGVIAVLAALSGVGIRGDELSRDRASGGTEQRVLLRSVLRDPRVGVMLVSTTLFQITSSSVLPFVTLRVKDEGGSDGHIAALVLVAQAAMIPVSVWTGKLLDRWGRRPILLAALVVQPAYIFSCAVVRDPALLVAVQALSGLSAGIFGVATIAVAADLTRGTGHFQALTGISRTAYAAGSIVGPIAMGVIVQRSGFGVAFGALSGVAALAAVLFAVMMPETLPGSEWPAVPVDQAPGRER